MRFEVAAADSFPGSGYTLITFVDSLHDLGDPETALRHARQALAPGGAVLLVEPAGADRVQENFNPNGDTVEHGARATQLNEAGSAP